MKRQLGLAAATLALGVAAAAALADAPGAMAFSWQQAQAKPLPNGDLGWAPRPFVFEKGDSVKHIDFEAGNDDGDGSRERPWKHHPWDNAATGAAKACTGIHTYVFKRGVIYRGEMIARESGQPGQPIRLSSDPSWGQGEARIYGSARLTGGWKKCMADDAPGIPDAQKVWYNNLGETFDKDSKDTKLSAIWRVDGKEVQRLHIARAPNWALTNPDDPTGDWHLWETFLGTNGSGWLADKKHWTGNPRSKDAKFFDGGVIWTQHRHLMGTVHRVPIQQYDPSKGAFKISSPGGAQYRRGGDANTPYPLGDRVHYYIENVRGLLDTPGEYFFDVGGPFKGRLYLRLPDDSDPNKAVLEAAQVRSPIQIYDKSDIEVSGLSFSFNDDDDGLYGYPWQISASPMVRAVGNCRNITVRNCTFTDVMNAVVAFPRPSGVGGPAEASKKNIGAFADDVMENIVITDNDVRHNDMQGAIWVVGCSGKSGEKYGVLKGVQVLRNRVVHAGFRPGKSPTSSIPAISVVLPETAEIAGNVVSTSWGNGIFTLGGKGSGATNDAPLSRILIHHNLAENTMLGCNDYGGIEMFQGGPAYFYSNIARNTVGTRTFNGEELGYSLYLDGGFKIYSFNNILEGKTKPGDAGYYNHCGYFMVFGFMDHFFNNTVHRFQYGFNGSSGNRSCILGNVLTDCSRGFMVQNRPGDVSMNFGGDTGAMGRIGIATMVYGNNVFWGKPQARRGEGAFGMVGGTSGGTGAPVTLQGDTIEELRAGLEKMQCRVSQIGWHTPTLPLANPAGRDFRLAKDSAALDKGVKFFVPWGLYGVVGEWNFYKSQSAPQVVLGEDFYMQEELVDRSMYYFVPRNDLTVSDATPQDYVSGPLEDWIEGALRFDGKSRFGVLTHADMTRDMTYPRGQTFAGTERKTLDMGTNNFLIEAYFKTDPGHSGGVVASKLGPQAGYQLFVGQDGVAALLVRAGGSDGQITGGKVNDGQWHHVVAEMDCKSGVARIYVDGKKTAEAGLKNLRPGASLANTADFLVGKGPDGGFFAGAMDFLRVSRGTLADAKTTIEELYTWEFSGPFLRDFRGNQPVGKRDAGAIERVP